MYNHSWGNMKIRIQQLLVGALVLSFTACSMLGDRKESTKLDLDLEEFSGLKVLSKKKNDATSLETDDAALEASDQSTIVKYGVKFKHPTLDVGKYIEENKVNFDQIDGTKPLPREGEIDRAHLFFGQGGIIRGNLAIVDATDDLKEKIHFEEQKASDVEATIKETSPTAITKIVFATGKAKIYLDETNIDRLAANSPSKVFEGKSVRDDLMRAIEKQKLAQTDAEKKASADEIQTLLFKSVPPEVQNEIYSLFNPNVDPEKNNVTFEVAQVFIIGTPTDSSAPIVYVWDSGAFVQVPAEQVKRTEQDDGSTRLEFTTKKLVTMDQISTEYVINPETNLTLASITFGKEKATPVFQSNEHQKETSYVLIVGNAPASEEETNPTETAPETPVETKPVDGTTPAEAPATTTPGTAIVDSPARINLDPSNDPLVVDVPAPLKVENKPDAGKPQPSVPASLAPAKEEPKAASSSSSMVVDAALLEKFGKKKFVPLWYNTKHGGYEREFYVNEGGKWVYRPGEANRGFWDDSYFKKDNGLTDTEVANRCSGYAYVRTLYFNINLQPPVELTGSANANYITGNSKGKFTKTYRDVLFDQLMIDIKDEPVSREFVDGATHPPKGASVQPWEVKVCFDGKKGFNAFWSSNETRSTGYRLEGKADVVFQGDNPKHWYPVSTNDHFIRKPPAGFNENRMKYPLSNLVIHQHPVTKKYAVSMQLGFQRNIRAKMLIAYINRNYISGRALIYSAEDILQKVENGFDTGPGRTETFIYGGFTFDPSQKGQYTATYMTAARMIAEGYVDASNSAPSKAADVHFPGEASVLNLIGQQAANGEVYASR